MADGVPDILLLLLDLDPGLAGAERAGRRVREGVGQGCLEGVDEAVDVLLALADPLPLFV